MLTPTGITLANALAAFKTGCPTHVSLLFSTQSIELTDSDISADGGITLNAVLNDETDLTIGSAVSRELTVEFLNGSVFDNFDWTEEFLFSMSFVTGGSTYTVPIGYFKGSKPTKTKRTDKIHFVAYDRMRLFDEIADDFLATLTFPLTMAQITTAMCTYLGIGLNTGDYMSGAMSYSYSKNPFPHGVTFRTILAWIAEANICYAVINAAGNMELRWFKDNTSNYSLSGNYFFDLDMSETLAAAADQVRISNSESGSGFVYPVSGTNIYQIVDNPLLLAMDTATKTQFCTAAATRFATIGSYYPIEMTAIGNFLVEAGDIIEIEYETGSTVNLPIFNRSMQWNGGCMDYYECTGQPIREEVTSSQKEKYATGGMLAKKYTVQSGVDITNEGVTVSGGKYVKIVSGGIFDVQSTNMDVNSTYGYIALKNIPQGYLPCNVFIGNHDFEADHRNLIIKPAADKGGLIEWVDSKTTGIAYENHASIYFEEWVSLIDGTTMSFRGIKGNSYQVSGGQTTNEHQYGDAMFSNLIIENLYGGAVKNNLTTTIVGGVLDARQGKALSDMIENKLKVYTFSIPNNGTRTLTISGSASCTFLAMTAANYGQNRGMWILNRRGSNSETSGNAVMAATNITVGVGETDNVVTFTKSGTYSTYLILICFFVSSGDPPTITGS